MYRSNDQAQIEQLPLNYITTLTTYDRSLAKHGIHTGSRTI